jgi:hypothetical protein
MCHCRNNIGPVSLDDGPFNYDRSKAVAYAAEHNCDKTFLGLHTESAWDYFWDKNPYSPFLHANCTNFVSQALASGGVPMINEWHWSFSKHNGMHWPITRGCGGDAWDSPCTMSWGYAPDLRNVLVNVFGFDFSVIEPVYRDRIPELSDVLRSKVRAGDVVFHGGGDAGDEYKHTSLVAGWGIGTEYQMSDDPQPCTSLPPSSGVSKRKLLPWIIDRDGPGYSRAFNDVGSPDGYRVEFVHIPDWITLPPATPLWDSPPYP